MNCNGSQVSLSKALLAQQPFAKYAHALARTGSHVAPPFTSPHPCLVSHLRATTRARWNTSKARSPSSATDWWWPPTDVSTDGLSCTHQLCSWQGRGGLGREGMQCLGLHTSAALLPPRMPACTDRRLLDIAPPAVQMMTLPWAALWSTSTSRWEQCHSGGAAQHSKAAAGDTATHCTNGAQHTQSNTCWLTLGHLLSLACTRCAVPAGHHAGQPSCVQVHRQQVLL